MRKLLSILLVIALSLPVTGRSAHAMARPSLDSVQALQVNGRTFCTAFSVGFERWMSAGHCGVFAVEMLNDGAIVTLAGMPVTGVTVDATDDLAVFDIPITAPAIPLARRAPVVGERVVIVGYPYGLPGRVTTFGYVAARRLPIGHPMEQFNRMLSDILDVTTAGGNSGSPVLNEDGELIGVLWGGFNSSPHSISVTYEAIQRVLR